MRQIASNDVNGINQNNITVFAALRAVSLRASLSGRYSNRRAGGRTNENELRCENNDCQNRSPSKIVPYTKEISN
jgi:hypothetical protein